MTGDKEAIQERLKRLPAILSNPDFLANKGLSNEVGIHICSYDPQDEMIVRDFFSHLMKEKNLPFNLVEKNLYEIFIEICEEKKILKSIPKMEETKGKEFLRSKLEGPASPDAFVEKLKFDYEKNRDILFITGVGEVYPFLRAHTLMDNIQHVFEEIPVLILYPGEYTGQTMKLFNSFEDGNYYRAFNII